MTTARELVERSRPVRRDPGGLRSHRADPGRAHGTTEPTEKYFDWTATPTSPVSGSAATMEKVALTGVSRIAPTLLVRPAPVASAGLSSERR